jgi:ATP-dependent Lon protease
MRRCAQEGAPVFRLPPMLLVGPPGIGKSHWSRALAAALGVPTSLVDAAAEAASFVVAGAQRGWGNAGPGKVLDTILNHRVLNPIVIVDEVEKAGAVRDTGGNRHNLTEALLALMEPKTAARWECPFYRVPFDMSGIGWIMTANSRRGLPEPLLSRCPPLVLPALSLSDLIGFAEREGAARGLTTPALDAIIETLQHYRDRADALSLRVVQRMLDRAEQLERRPVLN